MDVQELIALTHNIPFDDRINMTADISDLRFPLIGNYLDRVNSSLLADRENRSKEEILTDMLIAGGPPEYFKPLNVGLLFFHENPEKFFPYCRIEVVHIPDPTGQGMVERVFSGPIDQQLQDALLYIKTLVIEMLDGGDYSAGALYRMLGYSGNISKTFRSCIDDLLHDSTIRYVEDNLHSSNNVLTKNRR